jgi:hypothetical protein
MSVKRANEKRKKLDDMYKSAVLIKCMYCDIKDGCKTRVNKEKSEIMGITTYCTLTPNKTKNYIKKNKNK